MPGWMNGLVCWGQFTGLSPIYLMENRWFPIFPQTNPLVAELVKMFVKFVTKPSGFYIVDL
jgi:hypothetical protein